MAIISKTPDLVALERALWTEGKECRRLLQDLVPGLSGGPQEEPNIVFDDDVIRIHYQGRESRLSQRLLLGVVRRLLEAGKFALAYSLALLYDLDMGEEIIARAREMADRRDEMAMSALDAVLTAQGILREGGSLEAAYRKLRDSIAWERRSLEDSRLKKEYDSVIDDYKGLSVDGTRLGEYREKDGKKEIVLYLAAILPSNAMNPTTWNTRINTPEGREEVCSVFAHEYFHFLHHVYALSRNAGGEIVRESLATYFQHARDKEAGRIHKDLVEYCGIHDPYVYPYSGALQLEGTTAQERTPVTACCSKPRLSGDLFFREVFLESAEECDVLGSAQRLLLHRLDDGRPGRLVRTRRNGNGGILFANWLNDFRAYLIAGGKKPRTASSYLSYVRASMGLLAGGTQGRTFTSGELLALAKSAIADTEREIPIAVDFGKLRTLQSRLSALRSFQDWLSRQ